MDEADDFDLREFLPYLLNQAAEDSSLGFQAIYKQRYGMLRTDWRVLFHLGIYGRMTAREICDRTRMHKTKISRAVQRLSQRRFLTRDRDARDRRLEYLSLTPAGQAAYRELRAIARDYQDRLIRDLGEEPAEIARLLDILRRLARLSGAEPDRPPG